jgi:TonB family protein
MESPAVEGVLNSTYNPGTKSGIPFRMYVEAPMNFLLEGQDSSSHYPVNLRRWRMPPSAPKGVPANFQYDSPPVPYIVLPAVYPLESMMAKREGWAVVAFAIDPSGRARNITVTSASSPEFGPPAVAMFATWQFSSPLRHGVPCWAAASFKQTFDPDDEDVETDEQTGRILRALAKNPCPIIRNAGELDERLAVRYHPYPSIPDALVVARKPAHAVVEIVVDRAGHAQVPRIVETSREDFGWAVATAAGRWQFTVPRRHGDPVDVFVRIPFEYVPPRPSIAKGAPGGTVQLRGLDGSWAKYGDYLRTVADRIKGRWIRTCQAENISQVPGTEVRLKFLMNSQGTFATLLSVDSPPGAPGVVWEACDWAIGGHTIAYPKWTDAMIASLGREHEVEVVFRY